MWSVQALWLLLLPVSWVLLPVLQFLCFCCCFSGSAPAAVVVGARSAAIVFVHNNADSVAAKIQGNFDICVWVMTQDDNNPSDHYPNTLTRISIRQIDSAIVANGCFLDNLNNLGKTHMRSGALSDRVSETGGMFSVGMRVPQGQPCIVDKKACRGFDNNLCGLIGLQAGKCFSEEFRHQLHAIRWAERSVGLFPSGENMGGVSGVAMTLDQSIDLGNSTHIYGPS